MTSSLQDPPAVRAPATLLPVVCAAIFFDALDLSITQIALPSIQTGLGLSTSALPWVATAYVVTYGGFLLLGGRTGDILGARPVFLVGLAVFGIASLACGLAGDGAVLLGARVVQGVGAAATVPTAVAMLAAAFPEGPARNRAFATFAAAAASGFSAGLVLGGLITGGASWRWIFLAKVPLVAATLVAAVRSTPRSAATRRGRYDLAGALTATTGAILLLYGITELADPAAGVPARTIPLPVAALFLAAFAMIERRSGAPLLPPRLLRARGLVAADTAALTVLAAPIGVSFLATLYLQDVLHHSPMATALTLLPAGVASAAVGRWVAPRALDRFGLRICYTGALVAVAAGDSLLAALTPGRAVYLIVTATVLSLGIGMGVAYPAATVGGLIRTDPADHGAAAGLNNTALQVGGGLGLTLVAAVVTAALGGATAGSAAPDVATHAIRLGAVAITLIPLAGAVIAFAGLRESRPAAVT
ncbi:MFS transporter [Actinomadura rupiterrae]|uniref:MFS transporter n=1 Tax=Actinomadura rupiterrae TaxID=559627 RepID=UPI0020A2BD35|nr:MFS transporter [Actinomadura rupiterrae]MCP2337400.1 MFS family permease [Actinomadura rupiterrae]